jgi:hypothetical protein
VETGISIADKADKADSKTHIETHICISDEGNRFSKGTRDLDMALKVLDARSVPQPDFSDKLSEKTAKPMYLT